MSNMSYCRFHNTSIDLQDCYNALNDEEKLSVNEFRALKRLVNTCKDISEMFEDVTDIAKFSPTCVEKEEG